jgi:hypothetical protein
MSGTNHQIAHEWMNSGLDGRGKTSNGNLSYRDNCLFSYDTIIAQKVTNDRQERAVLVTTQTYSTTTSGKHMPACWSAINGGNIQAFNVPLATHRGSGSTLGHKEQRDSYIARYKEQALKLSRARKNQAFYLSQMQKLIEEAARFCNFFNLEALAFPDQDKIIEQAKARAAEYEAAEKIRRENIRAKALENLRVWLKGRSASIYELTKLDKTYLRVKGDDIETSRGVVFPVADAIKVYPLIKKIVEGENTNDLTFHIDSAKPKLGHFKIDMITYQGTVYAGCHVVEFDQIKACAEKLGLEVTQA